MVLPSHFPLLAEGQACVFRVGAFFFGGAEGSANLFTDLKAPALIEREGGTAMVPPSHFPLLAEGGACAFRVGAFFFWWCRGERSSFSLRVGQNMVWLRGRRAVK